MSHSMPRMLNTETIGEAWIASMSSILEDGEITFDDGRRLLERCNLCVSISELEKIDTIIESFADKSRIALMIEKYQSCSILKQYKISYGKLLYNYDNINQIEWLRIRLKNRPTTKSATIALHPPGQEYLSCLSLIDLKYRNEKLNMNCVYRSQNVFASQPGNLIVMKNILRDISEKLEVEMGRINLYAFSAHIYEENLDQAKEIVKKYNTLLSIRKVNMETGSI